MNHPTDEEIAKVSIRDNGEKLVSLREVCPEIEVRLPDFMADESEENRRLAQTGTASVRPVFPLKVAEPKSTAWYGDCKAEKDGQGRTGDKTKKQDEH